VRTTWVIISKFTGFPTRNIFLSGGQKRGADMASKSDKNAKHKIKNPTAHFSDAMDVAKSGDLTKQEKAKTLENWEADARRLAVATEEGMTGGEPSHVTDVAEAQASLGLKGKKSKSPTKSG
jgi:hypothetical protein